ncbi:hypothetical protein FB384_005170 [Prauserella sediminis]|uniref:Uncharacterized protein n=1 Tax=Prauserella sediminis TaxID=577680 RepID=A0A839XVR7_9PSEU|nr:hypothetical protein [Prauserella sediminis]MBB3666209.1 hypothetical protein [Prauserella sediminis]
MVNSHDEITRRLDEVDAARTARRAEAATTIGELARRHSTVSGQLADLERELSTAVASAADVIDIAELAQVTDVPAADLTRWKEKAAKPRGRPRKRPATDNARTRRSRPRPSHTEAASTPQTAEPDSPDSGGSDDTYAASPPAASTG